MDKLLTVKEVSELLSYSERVVYTLIDEGVIRAIKIRDKSKTAIRIPSSEIERIINEALSEPPMELSERRKRWIRRRIKSS
jgi:excisionase family DNA binding protein